MTLPTLTTLAYLVASVLFIYAIKGLASPKTARTGNVLGILGMAIAIVITLAQPGVNAYTRIAIAGLAGGAVGA
ncbi:MAG TPA: NAD(P)(+) transhydrogenase (Re/Si-specific) subunit beta, partial [Candidatus Polarisedimenticolia bacterium]|nr:NAD(P)(+) transhydrogenase (Re/Si-specific) subunit beta [Candidatus Polarisedimenticolia bacterium]